MDEHDMTRRLHDAAATVSVAPDLAEVEIGSARVRSRRRVATGVVAAMLVAGAGGAGFGLGRSVAEGDDELAVAAVPAAEQSSSATTAPAPPTAAPVAQDETTPVGPVATPVPAPNEAVASDAASDGDLAAGEVTYNGFSGYGEPYELLTTRTTATGERVRVQLGPSWGAPGAGDYGVPDWQPAAFCIANRDVRITIDSESLVDVTGAAWYDELYHPNQITAVTEFGWADGALRRLVVVQSRDGATDATITWSDGATDSAAFDAGVVALIAPADGPMYDDQGISLDYTVEVTGPNGTSTLDAAAYELWNDAEYRTACNPPPPALPDAGEQPADAAAAREMIEARFALLWDRSVPFADKPAGLVDDAAGVEAAIAQVYEGGFAEAAESAVHVIEDFVFTSPTEAWFRYGIDSSNGYFGERYGIANLVDGEWQFPRAVICQDLSLAGGTCEPGFEAIFPPSWYERYGGEPGLVGD